MQWQLCPSDAARRLETRQAGDTETAREQPSLGPLSDAALLEALWVPCEWGLSCLKLFIRKEVHIVWKEAYDKQICTRHTLGGWPGTIRFWERDLRCRRDGLMQTCARRPPAGQWCPWWIVPSVFLMAVEPRTSWQQPDWHTQCSVHQSVIVTPREMWIQDEPKNNWMNSGSIWRGFITEVTQNIRAQAFSTNWNSLQI